MGDVVTSVSIEYFKRQHFAGADEGLEGTFSSPDVIYGILPMVVAVGAGLWMALRG